MMLNTRIIVLVMAVASSATAEDKGVTKKAEIFSFEKLAQYNALATCFAKIHEQFTTCNKKAEEKGKAYLEGVDPNSEWAKRVKCCGTWKLRDCWVEAAKEKCDAGQVDQIHNLPYTFMKTLEEECSDYPPGSDKCKFPVWIVVVVVLSIVIILAIVIFFTVRFVRRRRLRAMRAATIEAAKVKPVPV